MNIQKADQETIEVFQNTYGEDMDKLHIPRYTDDMDVWMLWSEVSKQPMSAVGVKEYDDGYEQGVPIFHSPYTPERFRSHKGDLRDENYKPWIAELIYAIINVHYECIGYAKADRTTYPLFRRMGFSEPGTQSVDGLMVYPEFI